MSPNPTHQDREAELAAAVAEAAASGTPLAIRGGGTRAGCGRPEAGTPLAVAGHSGIVAYEPSELVVTVRGGTPLAELEAALAAEGQMLGFEPPRFGAGSTIGGAVASGLAGPRRAWTGGVRDALLGVRLLDGQGQALRFGGQVMKNVAGYDIARLQAGALGILGILLEVSLKVLPRPPAEATRVLAMGADAARARMVEWGRTPLPLAGAAWVDGRLHLRLAGNESAVAEAGERIGGEAEAGEAFWAALRDRTHPFFGGPFSDGEAPLWRLAVPPAAPALGRDLPGDWLLDWGGAQRWLAGEAPAERVRAVAREAGGHAVHVRGAAPEGEVLTPPTAPALAVQQRLKAAFDPHGILNPGRLYREL
ncbi:glycolate oxidase FAD binding subunit [Thiohalospira halophila DSM 15071]|uniref:Glycolate oxidase FAD binding subunit n=1 Tax=Thiohalospira halophila DSM 15071 TaxID=1123397 RepID=A0A1I1Q160_9GAMM|nr:glycolate oxidase subunit GlcE [Thiohalospira halophila]SFD15672.1 glycolate oxidase FAD binding subunit [Thiohalospira halophila DSM 15071]